MLGGSGGEGPMELVRIDGGLRIAVRRAGEGPAVLLLHGAVSDGREWRAQLDALSDEFTVVAWDAPGCGGSDDAPHGFGLEDYADCVACLADAMSLGRPHLAGLSFGGGLAIAVHERHPELPRSLVLVSAYAGWAGSLPPDEVARRLEGALSAAAAATPDALVASVPGVLGRGAPEAAEAARIAIMRDARPATWRAMAVAFAAADLRPALATIRVPALVVHGEDDERAPRPVAEALRDGIPGAGLVTLPGVGHQCNLEAPDRLSAVLRTFLRAAGAGPSRPRRGGPPEDAVRDDARRRRGGAATRRAPPPPPRW